MFSASPKEHLSFFHPQKKSQPEVIAVSTQLSFYEAVLLAANELATQFPHLTWQKDKPKEKEKTDASVNTIKHQSLILLQRLLDASYWQENGEIKQNAVENTVLMDWLHFMSEVSVGDLILRYMYKQDFGSGYKEAIKDLALNFVYAQAGQDILSWRAFTEAITWSRLNNSINEAAKDEEHDYVFLVTSPPDNVNYHGSTSSMKPNDPHVVEENHSFLNALFPQADGSVEVTQLRTWHNYAQWGKTHEDFGAGFAFEAGSAGSQLFANVIRLQFPKGTSREAMEQAVMAKVYKEEFVKKWHIKPDELPQFSEEGEKALWLEVMGMEKAKLLEISRFLAEAMADQKSLDDVDLFSDMQHSLVKDVFMPELITIVQQAKHDTGNLALYAERLEALQQLLISTSQQKTEWYNTNPKYVAFAFKQALKKFSENPTASLNTMKRLLMAKLHQHKQSSPELLTKEISDSQEYLKLNTVHLTNPASMTKDQLARFAQLTAKYAFNFTIGSALCHGMDVIKAAASSVGGEILSNFGAAANFTELIHLPKEARQEVINSWTPEQAAALLAYYEHFQYVELSLAGANTTWMVATYPEEESWLGGLGCRVDPDNPSSGTVVGPCPGEFEDEFGNIKYYAHGIPLHLCTDQPGGPVASKAAEFNETLNLLRQRAQEKSWQELAEQAKSKVAPDQQQEVEELLEKAYHYLIKRKVGLLEVINNDMVTQRAWLDKWLTKIAALLEGPGNPVLILRGVVEELLKHNPDADTEFGILKSAA